MARVDGDVLCDELIGHAEVSCEESASCVSSLLFTS